MVPIPNKSRKSRAQEGPILRRSGLRRLRPNGPSNPGRGIYRTKAETATAAAMAGPVPTPLRNWQRLAAQLVAPVALGALAFALVLAATDPPGPGLDPDAV